MAWIMLVSGIITFFALLFGPTAPYGRYSTEGWGVMIDSKIAWFTQEIWSFLVPMAWLICGPPAHRQRLLESPKNTILMAAFLIHYFNRDLIYPFRIRAGKPTPVIVWLLASFFCMYNGFMQSRYLILEAPKGDVLEPHFIAGILVWLTGWLMNMYADHKLINLRKRGTKDGRHKIPRGGLFEYVSAANYFGEIVEWIGFAIASWSLPATAFAFFTFANLSPRGVRHHQFYQHTFRTYPKYRRAVIPFLW